MTHAKSELLRALDANARGEWSTAFEILDRIDRASLHPVMQIQILLTSGCALHALGDVGRSIERYREVLSVLSRSNLLTLQPPPQLLKYAQLAAIGARDTEAFTSFLRMELPYFFSVPREFKISPVVDIRSWCRRSGIDVTVFDPAREVKAGNDDLNVLAWRYEVDDAWTASIPHAEIVSGWDFIVTPQGEVLEGAGYMPVAGGYGFMPHVFYPELGLSAHVWQSQALDIDEDALFLSTPESHHYGHWLNDFLPRLRAWGYAGRARGKLVTSAELPRKHRDLLARFGVRDEDLIACALGSRYRFRSLTVVRAGSDATPHPESLAFVRHALARTPPTDEQPKLRFFLIRDAGTRNPANVAEFDQVLEEFGIEKVNPARWSLETQERILADTSLIIAAFGTELLCLYHLPRGADVIELTFDLAGKSIFGPKSALLGLRHHVIDCTLLRNGPVTRRNYDFDIQVDCTALRRVLEKIEGRSQPDERHPL